MICKVCNKEFHLSDEDAGTEKEIYKVCSEKCVAEYEKISLSVYDRDELEYNEMVDKYAE